MGDMQICSWNAQALMATHKEKSRAKWAHCWRLLQRYDILALQETHSTIANTTRVITPPGRQIWWSHETQHTGGVGLIITQTFLRNFQSNYDGTIGDWLEVVPGRAAILRLEGPKVTWIS